MSKNFYEAVKNRRSYYGISKEIVATDDKIKEIVREAVKYTPSAFNSQSARVVLLLQDQHDRFWDITMEALRKVVPAEAFQVTEDKINTFKSGYGTVLYFEDQEVVNSLQKQFALYKDNFPIWSQQSSGMLQMVVWTALEAEGFGASLQHYGELVGTDVKKEWNISDNWKLISQMPFGKPIVQPDAKKFNLLEEHIKVFK
ncbi:MAG: nitroreductase family protein [Lachnospiraceae bacterium]|nr:nitroreductase family protein [Lachnospiraceae bacterium]